MKLVRSILLVATAAFCQQPVTTPSGGSSDDVPLPATTRTRGYSELEGVNPNEPGVLTLGKYQGGSAPLKPSRISTYVNQNEIVLVQSKQRYAIKVKDVTAVLYGNSATAQVGQAVGDAALTGARKENAKSPTLVGILWKRGNDKYGVVLQMEKGDFDNVMNALQTVTGLTAVNADAKAR